MPRHQTPLTVSGPYGQYTAEAIIDPEATFSRVPAPALIELGIEPHRVVRVLANGRGAQFRQVGRALTTVAGHEDVTPVLFGEAGEPAVIGATTLAILLLRLDAETGRLHSIPAQTGFSAS